MEKTNKPTIKNHIFNENISPLDIELYDFCYINFDNYSEKYSINAVKYHLIIYGPICIGGPIKDGLVELFKDTKNIKQTPAAQRYDNLD